MHPFTSSTLTRVVLLVLIFGALHDGQCLEGKPYFHKELTASRNTARPEAAE
jgi:hypothetical protein